MAGLGQTAMLPARTPHGTIIYIYIYMIVIIIIVIIILMINMLLLD